MNDALRRNSLRFGVAVPVLYFLTQLAAMPFYPGYSLTRDIASLLGSPGSSLPLVFNAGIVLSGIASILAAPGFRHSLLRGGTLTMSGAMLATLVSMALLSSGIASVVAGMFPLPDPRHDTGVLGIGVFAFPLLITAAVWPMARELRAYLALNLVAFAALLALSYGAVPLDASRWAGLVQRLSALTVYLPVGIVAWWLGRLR